MQLWRLSAHPPCALQGTRLPEIYLDKYIFIFDNELGKFRQLAGGPCALIERYDVVWWPPGGTPAGRVNIHVDIAARHILTHTAIHRREFIFLSCLHVTRSSVTDATVCPRSLVHFHAEGECYEY